jgi:hypothetical protein
MGESMKVDGFVVPLCPDASRAPELLQEDTDIIPSSVPVDQQFRRPISMTSELAK